MQVERFQLLLFFTIVISQNLRSDVSWSWFAHSHGAPGGGSAQESSAWDKVPNMIGMVWLCEVCHSSFGPRASTRCACPPPLAPRDSCPTPPLPSRGAAQHQLPSVPALD